MDNFKIEKINANSVEQHEKMLQQKLAEIQLDFADKEFRKAQEHSADKKETAFSSFVRFKTPLIKKLSDRHLMAAKEKGLRIERCEQDKLIEPVLYEIDKIYEAHEEGWQQEILAFIENEKGKIEGGDNEEKNNRAGILYYATRNHLPEAEELGVDKNDAYLEIHFEEFFKKGGTELKLETITKSLGVVAEKIVSDYPETRVVRAESWLMDSALADRLGFRIMKKSEGLDGEATWWQFMDKNGQIKEKVVKKFYKEGKLPYKVAAGVIGVEDFLKKYLPEKDKVELLLKELSTEFKDSFEEIEKLGDKLRREFKEISEDELSHFFDGVELLRDFFKTQEGEDLIDFLLEMKRLGYSFREIEEKEGTRINELGGKLQKYLNEKKYVSRKVVI